MYSYIYVLIYMYLCYVCMYMCIYKCWSCMYYVVHNTIKHFAPVFT